MCHEYIERTRGWNSDPDEDDAEDELPEFLNDADTEDAEILTDGGDE